jgi:hypothetical protein
MDYVAIKAELTTDPLGRGYASMSDAQAVASLNAVDRAVPNTSVRAKDVWARIDSAELATLLALTSNAGIAQKTAIQLILGLGDIDPSNASTQQAFVAAFGAASKTVKNLTGASGGDFSGKDLRVTPVSRAEELGLGQIVIGDVQNARALA